MPAGSLRWLKNSLLSEQMLKLTSLAMIVGWCPGSEGLRLLQPGNLIGSFEMHRIDYMWPRLDDSVNGRNCV